MHLRFTFEHLVIVICDKTSVSVVFSRHFLAQAMRELFWTATFYIAMLFALLKRNANDWSWHNQCILLWSVMLNLLCIIIYLYTGNIITTKQIIEIVAMNQTAFAMVALDIVIGLFISYMCMCFLYYIIFIC